MTQSDAALSLDEIFAATVSPSLGASLPLSQHARLAIEEARDDNPLRTAGLLAQALGHRHLTISGTFLADIIVRTLRAVGGRDISVRRAADTGWTELEIAWCDGPGPASARRLLAFLPRSGISLEGPSPDADQGPVVLDAQGHLVRRAPNIRHPGDVALRCTDIHTIILTRWLSEDAVARAQAALDQAQEAGELPDSLDFTCTGDDGPTFRLRRDADIREAMHRILADAGVDTRP